jgi:hypothetical protein
MIVGWYPMVLGGAVSDAREILVNVVGNRGHPGSCALETLPNDHEGHVGTGWDRYCRYGCCVVRGGHCRLGEISANVLMTSL